MKPLIGISASVRDITGSLGTHRAHTLSRTYTRAVWEAGGVPLLVPCEEQGAVARSIDVVDGLILSGGGDVDPAWHRRRSHPSVYGVDDERDLFELAVVRAARERRVPLLGICRGAQVVNVALGGDLLVDIPSEVGTSVIHRIAQPGEVARHEIRIDPSSRLAVAIGEAEVVVNSSHHQAVRDLGEGLRAVAWSADGVIEAVETDDAWPMLGVQWHPEQRPPDNAAAWRPFEALVLAARGVRRR